MRIFAFEYVTGGGLMGAPLPSLAREADLMLRSLVAELIELPGISVACSRDPRLAPIPGVDPLVPQTDEAVLSLFARGVASADAVWPIAPETGGMLERLGVEVLRQGKILLGSSPAAVRVAASKRATATALSAAGIRVVPTFTVSDLITPLPGGWVIKPDDGAGCEGVRRVTGWREALEALAQSPPGWVAQPWLQGDACSLSLLCAADKALLLAANRQLIGVEDERVLLRGVTVNALPDDDGRFAALGQSVAEAISGLWGYVGIDFVLTDSGPVVLEINPRLTTSYCGLGRVLGVNVAAMVLNLSEGGVGTLRPVERGAGSHQLSFVTPADD